MIDNFKIVVFIWGIWALLLIPNITMSQQGQFESLINKYEFSQNSVHSIWQDDFGLIWFATDVGLDRFDGDKLVKNCVRYSENFSRNNSISMGSIRYQDDYYLALHSNCDSFLYYLKYEKENFAFNQELKREKFPSCILDISDSLIYCKDGVYEVTGHKKRDYPIKSEVFTVSIDQENALRYYITEDSIYQAHLNGTRIIKSIANKRIVKPISAIIVKNKKLFIGNNLMQVWEIDFDQGIYTKIFSDSCPSKITSIEVGISGKLWIGTEDCGLYSISPDKTETQLYARESEKYQISRNTIYDVFISRDQSIWIGMNEGGVDRMVFEGDQYFNQEFLDHEDYFRRSNSVSAILPINDTILWISTLGNVIQQYNTLTDTVDRIFAIPDINAVKDFKIYAIENGFNSIYLGTTNGLYRYKEEEGFKLISFAGKTVYRLKYLAQSNELICGLNNVNAAPTLEMGLYRIRLSDNYLVDTLVKGVNILSLAFDIQTKAILGGTSKGYYKIPEIGEIEKNKLDLSIRSIFVDSSGIWLGSEKNGLRFIRDSEDPTNEEPVIQTQNNSDVETIYSITNDSYGNIWYSTISGLYQYFPSNKGFIIYTQKEGLSNNEFNFGAFGRSNNYLFWGGINGINSILLDNTNSISKSSFPDPQSSLLFKYYNKDSLSKNHYFKDSFPLVLNNEFKSLKITPIIDNYNEFPKNNIRYRLINRANNYQKGIWLYTSDYVIVDEFNLDRPAFAKNFLTDSEGELEIEIRNGKSNSWINKKISYRVKWSSKEHYMLLGLAILSPLLLLLFLILAYKNLKQKGDDRLKEAKIAFRTEERDKMKKVVDDLRSVQVVINDISRLDNTIDLGRLACKHFKDNFKFDYSIISIVK